MESIKAGKTDIGYLDEYVYLGQLISPEDNINKKMQVVGEDIGA